MKLQPKRGIRNRLTVLAAALGVAVVAVGCGGSHSGSQTIPVAEGVRIETVQMQAVPNELEAPGSVISTATAQLAARTTGTVMQVLAREGDTVKRGQLLAQLDEAELTARSDSAQAALKQATAGVTEATRGVTVAQAQAELAKKTYDRYVFLQKQKSVSPQEFDEVAAKQQAAQAGLEQAQARLQQAESAKSAAQSQARAAEDVASYARITAPFDGRIVRRSVDPGSLVTPGTPLFVVEDVSHYELEVTVPANSIVGGTAIRPIRRGTPARVEFDSIPGKAFSGRVAEIEAGADPDSHTVQARVALPSDPAIQSGLFGRAWFEQGTRNALLVAGSAVVIRGQLHGVYAADANGIAQWRVVTVGQYNGERVEILSGIGAGDQIVVNPGDRELSGERIRGSGSATGEKNP